MNDTTVEIYFKDLSKEKQEEILELLKPNDVNSAKDMNWDVFPVTSIIL